MPNNKKHYKRQQGYKNYKKGVLSELYAKLFLRCKGYKILYSRYKHFYGEIDILAQKKQTLIAVEVKYRKQLLQEHPVTTQQIEYLQKAMDDFFIKNHLRLGCEQARIDVIIINRCWRIQHIKHIIA